MRKTLGALFLVGSIATAAAQASNDSKEVAVYNACILAYFYNCEHGGKATNVPAAVIKACLKDQIDKLAPQCRDALNALD